MGLELTNLTKKDFKDMSAILVYGTGKRRRVTLYFDWKQGITINNKLFVGFKYMIKGYGCTKAVILSDAYNILIKKDYSELCWYDIKTAACDIERFRISISG